jgi:hypothetical protein
VFSDLLEALAESCDFKACFDGADLSRCRVRFMGQEKPASNTTTGGIPLSGKLTALSIMPAADSEVYLLVDTSAARLPAIAAGVFSPPLPPPGRVRLRVGGGHGPVPSHVSCPRAARLLEDRCRCRRAALRSLLDFSAVAGGVLERCDMRPCVLALPHDVHPVQTSLQSSRNLLRS